MSSSPCTSLKRFSVQFNDQADSGSLIKTLLLHVINQDQSLSISNDQNDTDAEKLKRELINVFTRIEYDTSPTTEVCPKKLLSAPHG